MGLGEKTDSHSSNPSYATDAEEQLCVEQSRELFSNIRGRGGASNACFHS